MAGEGMAAAVVMERCTLLAGISEEEGRLTRRYGTPALRRAQEVVAAWMRAAGMRVWRDPIGNVIGRYEGRVPAAPAILLGSHLDTVRDAGRYDGPLGVLVALACVERLHERGEHLASALEVLAFADEEGLRFQSTYLGSTVVAGTFDPAALALTDGEGVTLAAAVRAFGGDPARLAEGRHEGPVVGYCEVHIEQGPVLEARGLPLGAVSAIAGQTRVALDLRGEAGHAGTVPMALRRDALCAAAEVVLAAEALARRTEGLVATVGRVAVEPGASNVIPGRVTLTLDVRHHDDEARRAACATLREEVRQLCAAREVQDTWQVVQQQDAVACDAGLSAALVRAAAAEGIAAPLLPSGAGHDAVALARLCPVAMLFVRCRGGISHHPAESVESADVAAAIAVMERFLHLVAG